MGVAEADCLVYPLTFCIACLLVFCFAYPLTFSVGCVVCDLKSGFAGWMLKSGFAGWVQGRFRRVDAGVVSPVAITSGSGGNGAGADCWSLRTAMTLPWRPRRLSG